MKLERPFCLEPTYFIVLSKQVKLDNDEIQPNNACETAGCHCRLMPPLAPNRRNNLPLGKHTDHHTTRSVDFLMMFGNNL